MFRGATPLGPIRILQVEDSENDAELISMQLLEAGLEAEFLCVETGDELRRAMADYAPDLVLSDLSMPGFSGYDALRTVREAAPGLPFIFVSGTMGEEAAVQALREGANDYVLKDKTARLPAAVVRAIREARAATERVRVEKELLRSQRLDCLAMLAAGLSHDLRNILQPLLIVPDLLAMHSDDPKIHKLGQVISECGRRGHEMAESMLSFVRGSGAASEHVSVASLLQAVQMLLQGSLPRGVHLQVDALTGDLRVNANYTELQQALLNLCLNAFQAMPEGGTLTLSVAGVREAGRSSVCITVADTGVGMDAQTRAQLFTPFFTTKDDGTGLGLVSCKRIVDSYQGRIEVRSEPGQGTTFEIVLPVVVPDEAADSGAGSAMGGQGQRILIVDSDATRRSLVGNALASQGYEPMRAGDGAAALRAGPEDMPDLAIIDNDMPMLPAASLLSTMHGHGYAGPAIVLQDPERPLDRGALPTQLVVHVLDKPLQMRLVFDAVENALKTTVQGTTP